jgi:hypothetical protein
MHTDLERALVVRIDFGTLSGWAVDEEDPAAEDEVEAGARHEGKATA